MTGKLAEFSLRKVLETLSREVGFDYRVVVLPISVAALMHVDWVKRKLALNEAADRVVLPGWCQGNLDVLARQFDVPFQRGPKDLHDLPEHFGRKQQSPDLSRFDIEIIAEINHAPRLSDSQIVAMATSLRVDGADVIDLGCIPGEEWSRAGTLTRILRDEGCRVSIDSFNRREVEDAVAAGAELVLSCNGTNVDWASRLGRRARGHSRQHSRPGFARRDNRTPRSRKDPDSGSIRCWNRSAMDSAARSSAM